MELKNKFKNIFHLDSNALPNRSDLHLGRKLTHIILGTLFLLAIENSYWATHYWGFVFLLIAIVIFLIDYLRLSSVYLNQRLTNIFGFCMRESEKSKLSGTSFFVLGIALPLILFNPLIAVMAISYMVFADPLAAFFGVLLGKNKFLPNKSWVGVLAAFITSVGITVFYLQGNMPDSDLKIVAVLAGLFCVIGELLSTLSFDDNITIPLITGIGLTLLDYFISFNIVI